MKSVLKFLVGLIPFVGPVLLVEWWLSDIERDTEDGRQDALDFRTKMFIIRQPGGPEFLLKRIRGDEDIHPRA